MLNPAGTRILRTSRTILRPFCYEDILPMYYGYASKNEVTKYLNWQPYSNVEQAQHIINTFMHNYQNPLYFNWAIIDLKTNSLIGSISIHHVDESDENGELGICIDPLFWNKGLGYEVMQVVINYAFKTIRLHRLTARVHEQNIGSNRLMKKLEMTFEGLNRESFKKNYTFHNLNLYSLINPY